MTDRIDLHLHSTCSDGTSRPEAVVQKACVHGLKAISLTDHDCVDGVPAAMEIGKTLGVEVIPGTELSTTFDGKDIHILAYFIDCAHPGLLRYLQLFQDERERRAERIVNRLNQLGVGLTIEAVMARAGDGVVGRPHIADALVEEGYVFSVSEAFQKYLGYNRPAYEKKYILLPEEAVRLIHEAGGLACLAHPGIYNRDDLLPALVACGLDGIEAIHSKHTPEQIRRYEEFADLYGLLKTGGSDCHGSVRGEPTMGTVDVPYTFLEGLRGARQS
ncbi:MAG: PHP domain-containing protein [Candidatus Latescibacteria bacterium]|nr:PHP domain-containing protein [Candidatus Latescibacterota bacterium]